MGLADAVKALLQTQRTLLEAQQEPSDDPLAVLAGVEASPSTKAFAS